jgi:hypothetical protein
MSNGPGTMASSVKAAHVTRIQAGTLDHRLDDDTEAQNGAADGEDRRCRCDRVHAQFIRRRQRHRLAWRNGTSLGREKQ